jgi:hypothetical protein
MVALALSSCGDAESDCTSADTRKSVLAIVADDDHAALVNYAIKNSDAVAETVNNSASAKARDANLARVKAINDELAAMRDRIQQQSHDDISPYKERLDVLLKERAGLNSEYLKLDEQADAEQRAVWEKAKQDAVYALDDTILTNSKNSKTQTVTCSGLVYVKVGNTAAQKEVEFKVKRASDGRMSISVDRFLF